MALTYEWNHLPQNKNPLRRKDERIPVVPPWLLLSSG